MAEDTSFVRLLEYVLALAEFLFRWRLFTKRLELLKCLPNNVSVALEDNKKEEGLGLCKKCGIHNLKTIMTCLQYLCLYASVAGPN